MENGADRRRRRVLRTTAAVASGSLIAGCLSGLVGTSSERRTTSAVGTSGGSAGRGNEALRRELGLSMPDYEYGNTLRIYQWENYWPSGTIDRFQQAYGVETVTVDTYTANERIRATLRREGLDAYDLVFPSDWMVTELIRANMLAPLAVDKLSNWSNLADRWVERAPYDVGAARYSAPYQQGTTGIGWNSTMIDTGGGIDSWDAMWNERWAGQMTMLDNKRETIGAALKRLGYSLNTRDEAAIEAAKESLIEQKRLLKGYDSDSMPSSLADARASPIHTWNGEAFLASSQFEGTGGDTPIEYTIPREGGVVWVDTAAIPRRARNPNTAHLFVDYLLNARVGAMITNFNNYATPNEAARQYLDDSLLENELIFPPPERLSNLEFIRSVGDAARLYQRAWNEIKNA